MPKTSMTAPRKRVLKKHKDFINSLDEQKLIDNPDIKDGIVYYLAAEAIQWRDAAIALKNSPRKSFSSQICVLLCLSAELFLKAFWTNEKNNINFRNSHNLLCLYHKISSEKQQIISADVSPDKNVFKDFDTFISFKSFEEELEYISDDFVSLRYEYEKFILGENIILAEDFLLKLVDNLNKLAHETILA